MARTDMPRLYWLDVSTLPAIGQLVYFNFLLSASLADRGVRNPQLRTGADVEHD